MLKIPEGSDSSVSSCSPSILSFLFPRLQLSLIIRSTDWSHGHTWSLFKDPPAKTFHENTNKMNSLNLLIRRDPLPTAVSPAPFMRGV